MKKKNIGVITGSRAEYDLLKPIIKELKKKNFCKLSLIVTGSHLSKKFGFTYKKIIKDKIKIDKKINILDKKNDDEKSICFAISRGISKFANIFQKNKYDFILVLGDRFEILSTVVSAAFFKIPIIHISGGEISTGSIDDSVRHVITKLSSYHFVSHKIYKDRVIQLGEDPNRVFDVGSTGPENIKNEKLLNKIELQKEMNFIFKKENFLITYHPVTYERDYGAKNFKILLKVLSNFKKIGLIFTMPNSDIKNNTFHKMIEGFVKKNKNSKYFMSLGSKKYFSCVNNIDIVIGNSSSGLIEIPSFKKPTLNLGKRQNGRISPKSVIDCENITERGIISAIKKIKSKKFQKLLKTIKNPLEKKNSTSKIIKILTRITRQKNKEKIFYDLKKYIV